MGSKTQLKEEAVNRLFGTLGSKIGDENDSIFELQKLLGSLGYLYLKEMLGAYEDLLPNDIATPKEGVLDETTSRALRFYQVSQGLPPTGLPDETTITQISQPRCGFPDKLQLENYALQGNRWESDIISYEFLNYSPDLQDSQVRSAIESAFNLWAEVTPLSFVEASGADIKISFVSGEHGDGHSFDGPGNVLAHAFFPPPNAGPLAGDTHFDEAETWAVDLPIPKGAFDLVTVAAHEFGHSLGLRHSTVSGALMYPSYSGPHRFLHKDDIAGIQAIYGQA